MDFSALPLVAQVAILIGLGIGATWAAGRYVSRTLAGDKGTTMSSVSAKLDAELGEIRKLIEARMVEVGVAIDRVRNEMVTEIRGVEARVRGVENGQSRMQGMLDAGAAAQIKLQSAIDRR